jgi:hypothetical protein
MTTRAFFGINIAIGYAREWGKLLERVRDSRPSVLVCHVDKPDQVARAAELMPAAGPDCVMILRTWHPKEKEFHWRDHAQNRRYVVNPVDYLNDWMFAVRAGFVLQPLCDIDGSAEPQRAYEWCAEIIAAVRALGFRHKVLALPSYAVGNPPLWGSPGWTEWHTKLLQLISANRDLVYYCANEYGPGADRIGRIRKTLVEPCQALGLELPECILSENGVDAGADALQHFRSRGWTGRQYGAWLVGEAKAWYVPLIEGGLKLRAACFVWGDSGGFDGFNLEQEPDFWDVLLMTGPLVDYERVRPPPVPEPPPPPHAEDDRVTLRLTPAERTALAGVLERLLNA